MPIYKVNKIYKYGMTVEVEAESRKDAKAAAMELDGEHNEDDYLYDVTVSET